MATVSWADGGILYGMLEAMSHSDGNSIEEDKVSSRRGGARLDASGASKAGKKTNARTVQNGAFVGPGQTTLGLKKRKGPFENRQ
jgi:hypothetical protein